MPWLQSQIPNPHDQSSGWPRRRRTGAWWRRERSARRSVTVARRWYKGHFWSLCFPTFNSIWNRDMQSLHKQKHLCKLSNTYFFFSIQNQEASQLIEDVITMCDDMSNILCFTKGWRAALGWTRVPALDPSPDLPGLPPRLHARHCHHHSWVLGGSSHIKVLEFALILLHVSAKYKYDQFWQKLRSLNYGASKEVIEEAERLKKTRWSHFRNLAFKKRQSVWYVFLRKKVQMIFKSKKTW